MLVVDDVVDLTLVNTVKTGRTRPKKKNLSPRRERTEPYSIRRKERLGRKKNDACEPDALATMLNKATTLVDPFFESYSKLYASNFKRPPAPQRKLTEATNVTNTS